MRNLKDDIRDGLSELGETVRRLRGTSDDTLLAALEAFANTDADDLALLTQLFAELRPRRGESAAVAVDRFNRMVSVLREARILPSVTRRARPTRKFGA